MECERCGENVVMTVTVETIDKSQESELCYKCAVIVCAHSSVWHVKVLEK